MCAEVGRASIAEAVRSAPTSPAQAQRQQHRHARDDGAEHAAAPEEPRRGRPPRRTGARPSRCRSAGLASSRSRARPPPPAPPAARSAGLRCSQPGSGSSRSRQQEEAARQQRDQPPCRRSRSATSDACSRRRPVRGAAWRSRASAWSTTTPIATAAAIATTMLSFNGSAKAATAAQAATARGDPGGAVGQQRVGQAQQRQRAGEAEAPVHRDRVGQQRCRAAMTAATSPS